MSRLLSSILCAALIATADALAVIPSLPRDLRDDV
jgi:hypothetical protein